MCDEPIDESKLDDSFFTLDDSQPGDCLLKKLGFFDESIERKPPTPRNRSRANGEGSIRKKNKGWEGRITVGYDINGKQIRKSVYAKTRKECNERMLQLQEEYAKKQIVVSSGIVLIDWLNTWMSKYMKNRSFSTTARYRNIIDKVQTHEVAQKPIEKILQIDLQDCLLRFNSYEMCKRTIGMFRNAFQKAMDNGLINKNPASSLENPIPVNAPKYLDEEKAFTDEEEKLFVDAIQDNKYRILYMLVLEAGLRPEEACALHIKNISFETSQIKINTALSRSKKGYALTATKTQSGIRNVPISNRLKNALAEIDKQNTLVYERNGTFISPNTLTNDFLSIMKTLGMKHTLYHLRHTFCTKCHKKGIDIKVVQRWMGHKDTTTTLNTYTHATKATIDEETKKFVSE